MKFNFKNFCICMTAIVLAANLVNKEVWLPTMITVGVIAGFMFPYVELK